MILYSYLENSEYIGAVVVNGYKSLTWTERYREPGEFKIVASLSSGIQDILPLDALVSHTDTEEIMIVESHVILDRKKENSVIEISGRTLDTFMEERAVDTQKDWVTVPTGVPLYELNAGYTWDQAALLINTQLQNDEAIPYVTADTDISGSFTPSDPVDRVVRRGSLYDRVKEILAVDDLGLRTVRTSSGTYFRIHNGKDQRGTVIFSSKFDEIESADYLWTTKMSKNAVLVTGTWLETLVTMEGSDPYGLERRVGFLSAEDIDQHYAQAPLPGPQRDKVLADLITRGRLYLAAQRRFMVTAADVSQKSRFRYRRDYGIGDIVMLQSNYRAVMPMRVVEYTEIEDENGQTGHPTLGVYDY